SSWLSKLVAQIFAVDPAEFAQELLRSLVEELGERDPHLDDEIAAAAVARRGDALLPQPEALSRLRARRHAQPRRSVERRHSDLGAERRLVNRDRDREVQIVPFTPEERMRLHAQRDVQIARVAAVLPRVPLGRYADPC